MSDETAQSEQCCPNCGAPFDPWESGNPDADCARIHCEYASSLVAERDRLRAKIEAIRIIIDSGASHEFSKTAIRAALEAVR